MSVLTKYHLLLLKKKKRRRLWPSRATLFSGSPSGSESENRLGGLSGSGPVSWLGPPAPEGRLVCHCLEVSSRPTRARPRPGGQTSWLLVPRELRPDDVTFGDLSACLFA